MANEVNLNLDPETFMNIVPERMAAIRGAPETALPAEYPADRLVKALHPEWQYAKISRVEDHGTNARSFTLTPDREKGTESFAYFSAGQYVCVYLAIGGSRLLKPYSIRSAPADALEGSYVLTVKRTTSELENGFASDYILDNWAEGGQVILTGPVGNFTYEPLRDAQHILGIAAGSGITPFCSLASAIADGTEDCSLTLLYGSRRADDILLKDLLDEVSEKTNKVKVIHIISDEQAAGYEHGNITAELIKKYAPAGDFSIFMCGPQGMREFCNKQIETLAIPERRVRRELLGECKTPDAIPDYPGLKGGRFTLTVISRDKKQDIPCAAGESLLAAMEKAGIAAASRCRSGECGFCNAKLLSGEVFVPSAFDKRRLADITFGYIHSCVSFPLGDITIDIPVKLNE